MASYAALNSLMYILQQIQHHPRPPITIEKQQMDSLCENISSLQNFLEIYSHRDIGDEVKESLETQIADAAYAAEDIIESHVVDQVLTEDGENSSNNLFYQDLQKVMEGMKLIKKKLMTIQEKVGGINGVHQLNRNSVSTGSSTVHPPTRKNTNTMVGFDDVLIQIMDRLTGYPTNRQVLPIVGMGGIGKTTLVTHAYHNPLIVKHFDICIWITVSPEFRFRDILLEALSYHQNVENKSSTEDELGLQLYKSLCERRYLIVLDDVWSIEAWEKLMLFLPDNNNGCRIMITTRLSNVAKYFGSSGFKMDFLDEDKSLDLLCKIAFPQDQLCPPELKEIGKKIAKNCKGLPLTIVVIAGLLANSEKTHEYWEYVSENLYSLVNLEDNHHCLKVLALSYNHLPVHLKPCFLHMGVFPEDYNINVSLLIKLWVAEGFLKPIPAKSLEVVAEEYLRDLIDRNLISATYRGSSGTIKFCKMHDLLRDLCLEESQKDKFLRVRTVHDFDFLKHMYSPRRISIYQSASTDEFHLDHVIHNSPLISLPTRSLICDCKCSSLSRSFRLLRILSAVGKSMVIKGKKIADIYSLETVLQLVNSRYLAFRADWISDSIFPSSIHQLWNLQTLIVKGKWGNPTVAPPEIWDMLLLRHLEFDWLVLLDPPSVPIHKGDGFILRNLHTLSEIINFRLSEEVIKRIPSIKKLRVHYVNFPEGWCHDYGLNNLGCLNQLESLVCVFLPEEKPNRRIELLQNLSFPHSLKKLSLDGCRLHWEDMTMIGSLPHLQVLKLKSNSFCGPEWNTVEGEFLCLKFLHIEWCVDLVHWTAESTHFPSLEHLCLQRLDNLKEIPLGIGEIPTLHSIELFYCGDSALKSAKNLFEKQAQLGNMDLRIHVIVEDKIELWSLATHKFQDFKF